MITFDIFELSAAFLKILSSRHGYTQTHTAHNLEGNALFSFSHFHIIISGLLAAGSVMAGEREYEKVRSQKMKSYLFDSTYLKMCEKCYKVDLREAVFQLPKHENTYMRKT